MQSKETKLFVLDGEKFRFNATAFNRLFILFAQNNKIKKGILEDLLANKIGVTKDAVHNWRFAKNGPSDIEMIKTIAEVLNITDWMIFTKSIDGGKTMEQLTERQKDALKRVYDSILDFLFEFKQSDGFNEYWLKFSQKAKSGIENMLYEYVEEKVAHLFLILDKEYFDLGKHDIYNELCEYVSENIYELFDGKLSYAYRFEADGISAPTTYQDYNKAMMAINTIIEKYI